MASARIHEAIALEVNKKYNMDEVLLRLGTVAPDSWRNMDSYNAVDKYISHFWNFKVKKGQANDYVEFYLKYYSLLNNPFYFGYLIHLIVDQYWKTNIDTLYEVYINDCKFLKLKDGTIHSNSNHFAYYEGIKLQKKLSKIYNLSYLPINSDEVDNLYCVMDEFNLSGLFGDKGTINYINNNLLYDGCDLESSLYNINDIINYIKKTAIFVESELERLKHIKKYYDNKIKIAIDMDNTVLNIKKSKEYYWKSFLNSHSIENIDEYNINNNLESLFWKEYGKDIILSSDIDEVVASIKKLHNNGYVVNLISSISIDKWVFLKKILVNYFDKSELEYNYLILGLDSKLDYLVNHKYDFFVDSEISNVMQENNMKISSILYSNNNCCKEIKTCNWNNIDDIINSNISKEKTKKRNISK